MHILFKASDLTTNVFFMGYLKLISPSVTSHDKELDTWLRKLVILRDAPPQAHALALKLALK